MIDIVIIVTFLSVKQCITSCAFDQIIRYFVSFFLRVRALQVFLQIKLNNILHTAQVTIVNRLSLVGIVDLDLLRRGRRWNRFKNGHDSFVCRFEMIVLRLCIMKDNATLRAGKRTSCRGILMCFYMFVPRKLKLKTSVVAVTYKRIVLTYFQRKLHPTKRTKMFRRTLRMFPELVLNG